MGKIAVTLNRHCACTTLDLEALHHELGADTEGARLYRAIVESRPHLLAATPVFLGREDIAAMQAAIDAVEAVAALPGYLDAIAGHRPSLATQAPRALGVFFGYDFHFTDTGPRLIEINTNAGGAFINALLARAHLLCCVGTRLAAGNAPERAFFDMFLKEWRRERAGARLQRIAIVDDTPDAQYLEPEFVLARRLFEANGIEAVVTAPEALTFRDGRLWLGPAPIDLVYNRLTDFALAAPQYAALAEAYAARAVVLTPHPYAYWRYADKRNLVTLSDDAALAQLGAPAAARALLKSTIPATRLVTADAGDYFWQTRDEWFFKPATGYGSKAAYRGDKVTKRVFAEILAKDYVAQAVVPPSTRRVIASGADAALSFDVRCYVYDGEIQLVAARLYRGQTTNFRTAGGGFAPVMVPGVGRRIREICPPQNRAATDATS